MKIIKIKGYDDLKGLEEVKDNNFIINLEECILPQKGRVIDFLCGLTFLNGTMKKLNNSEFEIKMKILNVNENRDEIKVKHYEEKLNDTDFKNTFKQDYSSHLKQIEGIKKTNPYHDPDSVKNGKAIDPTFYMDLTVFLNKRATDTKKDLEFIFNDKKIDVISVNESKRKVELTLTSDQFGFSAPRIENGKLVAGDDTPSSPYPYAKFIGFSANKEEAIELIVNTIYNTRTIGGSFLWPIKNGQSQYNLNRGCKSYIEDCVDLTLLEIKHFYKILDEYQKEYKDLSLEIDEEIFLSMYKKHYGKDILLASSDKDVIIKWLSLFTSFKEYINFFRLDDFVDASYEKIVDIFKSDIDNNVIKYLETDSDYNIMQIKERRNHNIGIISKEEIGTLERIIKNIGLLTLKRSDRIENNK